MSGESTKTIPVKRRIEITIEQLDVPGAGIWYVNGTCVTSSSKVEKEVLALIRNGDGGPKVVLSIEQAMDEVRTWRAPFSDAHVQALDGIGPDKAAKAIKRLQDSGEVEINGEGRYVVKAGA